MIKFRLISYVGELNKAVTRPCQATYSNVESKTIYDVFFLTYDT